ncbi:MBL fold metallo-hydrolase [Desulfuromonas acetoxidans]|uniref:Metal-dependent hydrolase n=1 Tax=Desulfuromonas acetoxidans (strain DSM 684 / 11070) TaxID=281689 RepID=Q1JYG5_DESA6|nr:MBL fold metallo-hydrolase [Desulfuromonas acetoxidans]EAT15241.1 putative metal-dependent hydrolase [Desulfuromonas acetoxidans DSM 684]MBF0645373.1 MBL fold metallo-hydrolase [Desulfuromonas acetoxidans]NVD23453.1 MBL fold metallo-hydrolase [Desulfuromonas acetoxidans]NVE15308.1 MBL fold metallo-hydrolase [Desulfuromonas acetoxidans]
MKTRIFLTLLLCCLFGWTAAAQQFEHDTIDTSAGPVEITFIGHATLMLTFADQTIHIDPWTYLADYSHLPKADLILITHEHRDHLDTKAVDALRTPDTEVVLTEVCAEQVSGGMVMHNGDVKQAKGLKIEAVPAYNNVHMRSPGVPYHPKGRGNGYVLTFGDKKIYIGGDTENIAEMKDLKEIAVAFLPMNLPYTMTPAMVADAARMFKPEILYPYHYGQTDTSELVELLKEDQEIEVRIRKMNL